MTDSIFRTEPGRVTFGVKLNDWVLGDFLPNTSKSLVSLKTRVSLNRRTSWFTILGKENTRGFGLDGFDTAIRLAGQGQSTKRGKSAQTSFSDNNRTHLIRKC